MARFGVVVSLARTLACAALSFLGIVSALAQINNVTNTTATPIPGAGHDYIRMLSETVNPANGSLSVRIDLPTPKGRGITIPFSVAYDSNGVNHLEANLNPYFGTARWATNIGYLLFNPRNNPRCRLVVWEV